MTTSNLRTTSVISEYLETVDAIELAEETVKTLRSRQKLLAPRVIAQIGDRRAVIHDSTVRILRVDSKETYQLAVTEAEAVEYCQSQHIPIDTRSELWLSPAKRTKYGRERLLPQSILAMSSERILVVD